MPGRDAKVPTWCRNASNRCRCQCSIELKDLENLATVAGHGCKSADIVQERALIVVGGLVPLELMDLENLANCSRARMFFISRSPQALVDLRPPKLAGEAPKT